MLEIGSVIDGKYKILNQIGQGGMSVVYLAMVEKANKQWAIKEVRKDGVQNYETVCQGLAAEINMLKKLSNPHLPSIVDVIDSEDTFLIVMDYIEGITLKEALREYGVQSQENVIDWAKQLCEVLGYLHSRIPPIIYRDMKPSNIMLKPDGEIILIDFGTAREFKDEDVEDTVCLGTKGYAAPEQFGGCGQTDGRTDIYCLGATLYHLITGHNPSEPPYEIYPIREWNPNLSPGLEKIILKCTQKNPEDRYQSCEELLYALRHYNELDEAYKKRQTAKVRNFSLLCFLSVFFLVFSVFANFKVYRIATGQYSNYMEQAEIAASEDKKIDYYTKAIRLNPKKDSAYLELINTFVRDEFFSVEEDKILSEILNASTKEDNDTFLNILKKNQTGYGEVAYSLGMAYWYYYEQVPARKPMSVKWFQDAADVKLTDEEDDKAARAKVFSRIGEYYLELGKKNMAGDVNVTYKDYWEDLILLLKDDIKKKDNSVTALRLYDEVAGQICTHTKEFMEAGVTETELSTTLNRLEKEISRITVNDSNRKIIIELKEAIADNIGLGRKKIVSTYHQVKEREVDSQWSNYKK